MKKIDEEKLKELKEKNKELLLKEAQKSKGFISEFKEFISKGNVVDMAVGVIIGSAFGGIVTSFTDNFISPLLQLVTGNKGTDVVASFTIKGVVFDYGSFISTVLDFLIIAFVLFIVVKNTNKLMNLTKKKEEDKPAEPPKKPDDVLLLEEIRDLLKKQK